MSIHTSSDFQSTLALREQNETDPPSIASAKLERKIAQLVSGIGAKTRKGSIKTDPILGGDSALVSVSASFQRFHGMHLPTVLGHALSSAGLVVMHEEKVPILKAAKSVVAATDIATLTTLAKLAVSLDGDIDGWYRADLVVYCPKTKWVGVFDGKRGLGNSDSAHKAVLEQKLRAVRLSVISWMQNQGYDALTSDVRIIDFYGCSGYAADLKMNGSDLDAYFGAACNLPRAMAMFTKALAVESATVRHLLAPHSDRDPALIEAKPVDSFGFPDTGGDTTGDFLDPDIGFPKSLAIARLCLSAAHAQGVAA